MGSPWLGERWVRGTVLVLLVLAWGHSAQLEREHGEEQQEGLPEPLGAKWLVGTLREGWRQLEEGCGMEHGTPVSPFKLRVVTHVQSGHEPSLLRP